MTPTPTPPKPAPPNTAKSMAPATTKAATTTTKSPMPTRKPTSLTTLAGRRPAFRRTGIVLVAFAVAAVAGIGVAVAQAQGADRFSSSAAPDSGRAVASALVAPAAADAKPAAAAPRSGRAAAVAPVAPSGGAVAERTSAQGISVTVALPAVPLTVGERAEAVVTVRVPAARLAADPRFPVWRDAWGEAEVREHGDVQRRSVAAGEAAFSQRLVLAAFRTGKIELPRMTIAVPLRDGTVQALTPAGLALAVRSVLPSGGKEVQPRPAAALRPLPLGWAFYWVLGVLLVLVGLAVWALRRQARRRAAAGEPAAPPLPQLAELLASLDGLAGRRAPLAVHIGISQALRRYLGRAAGIPAPESTTSEIQRRLLARGWPAAMVRRTAELLRACDMVKFAREDVGEARAAERLAQARQLGQDFETQIEARAALAAAAAAAEVDERPAGPTRPMRTAAG